MIILSLYVIGELLMELTVEAVIKDINMSLPERKLNQRPDLDCFHGKNG